MDFKKRAALAWKIIWAGNHGNMLKHANAELALALPGTDEMDVSFRRSVEEVIFTFSLEGHSGFSVAYAIGALEKLLRFEPLTALTGADDEWCDMSEYSSGPMWQNRRNSRVFKEGDGRAYIIDHFIFVEPDGATFTDGTRKYIEFPYEGEEPERVQLDGQGIPTDPKYLSIRGGVRPVPDMREGGIAAALARRTSMTTTSGPGKRPFITISFANLTDAHVASSEILALRKPS